MRQKHILTKEEYTKLKKLPYGEPDHGHDFWATVALSRGLDPETVIGDFEEIEYFTALPLGHGKHWCYPYSLKCKRSPKSIKIKELM